VKTLSFKEAVVAERVLVDIDTNSNILAEAQKIGIYIDP